jgi:O-antigen/teichoic acid export membrane protein
MLRFGADLSATHLLVAIISNVDRILIGKYFGAAMLGFYRQAQQLLVIPVEQLNQPIIGVAQPALSALQGEPDRYRRYYEKIVLLVALTTLPMGVFIALYADEITLIVLGPAWAEAAVFIRIFGIAATLRPVIGTSAVVLISSGHTGRYLVTAVGHSLVLLAFMLIGLRWGATGIAVAQVATTVALLWPKLYYSFAQTPVSIPSFFTAIRTPMIATAGMTIGLLVLRELGYVGGAMAQLTAGILVGGTLYLACWWVQPRGRDLGRSLMRDVRSALARAS